MLTHPDQLDALQQDRDLIPAAIEEGLRFETALVAVPRTTTREVEIRGMIPSDRQVNLCIGSAGAHTFRSRAVFTAALACTWLGVETRAMLNSLFDRVTDLQLVSDEDTNIVGMPFRSPTNLAVTFRPAS